MSTNDRVSSFPLCCAFALVAAISGRQIYSEARADTPDDIQITEKLGASIPLDLEFVDDRGNRHLEATWKGQPLVWCQFITTVRFCVISP